MLLAYRVRASIDAPIIRKDFMLDPYQVFEARAARSGTDTSVFGVTSVQYRPVRRLLISANTAYSGFEQSYGESGTRSISMVGLGIVLLVGALALMAAQPLAGALAVRVGSRPLVLAGGLYRRARVQYDGELGASGFVRLFADHEHIDNGPAGRRTAGRSLI